MASRIPILGSFEARAAFLRVLLLVIQVPHTHTPTPPYSYQIEFSVAWALPFLLLGSALMLVLLALLVL